MRVRDTLSSSRPFLSRSSLTAFCTPWMKSWRLSSSSCIVIATAAARRASTNLSSTSCESCSGSMVRTPSVCAAFAMPSLVGTTRTKKATTTSTRMRSLVNSESLPERVTSSLSVFMLTRIVSWKTGNTSAPPSMTIFWPPRPVRTKARSFDERRYRREKMSPITSSARKAMPTSNRLSIIRGVPIRLSPLVLRICVSDQVRPGIDRGREAAARDLLRQQHALATLERHALGFRLDHHINVLPVLVRHARLCRIALARCAADDGGNAADQRLERHGICLVLRDHARKTRTQDAYDRQRREEGCRDGNDRRHPEAEEAMRDHVERKSGERESRQEQHHQHEEGHAPDVQPAEQLVERTVHVVPRIRKVMLQHLGERRSHDHRHAFDDGDQQHEKSGCGERPCFSCEEHGLSLIPSCPPMVLLHAFSRAATSDHRSMATPYRRTFLSAQERVHAGSRDTQRIEDHIRHGQRCQSEHSLENAGAIYAAHSDEQVDDAPQVQRELEQLADPGRGADERTDARRQQQCERARHVVERLEVQHEDEILEIERPLSPVNPELHQRDQRQHGEHHLRQQVLHRPVHCPAIVAECTHTG